LLTDEWALEVEPDISYRLYLSSVLSFCYGDHHWFIEFLILMGSFKFGFGLNPNRKTLYIHHHFCKAFKVLLETFLIIKMIMIIENNKNKENDSIDKIIMIRMMKMKTIREKMLFCITTAYFI